MHPTTSKSPSDYTLLCTYQVLLTLLILIGYYHLLPTSDPCNTSFLAVGAIVLRVETFRQCRVFPSACLKSLGGLTTASFNNAAPSDQEPAFL